MCSFSRFLIWTFKNILNPLRIGTRSGISLDILSYGVPQGSVLASSLCSLFASTCRSSSSLEWWSVIHRSKGKPSSCSNRSCMPCSMLRCVVDKMPSMAFRLYHSRQFAKMKQILSLQLFEANLHHYYQSAGIMWCTLEVNGSSTTVNCRGNTTLLNVCLFAHK